MAAYLYPISLAIISGFVMVLEALFPWRREQKQLRRAFVSDLIHLTFNGHFLGVVLYAISARWIVPEVDRLVPGLNQAVAASWPMWLQIIAALFVIDFVHWCVHNSLHRVPFLWELHKTHHSVVDGEMDWIVSFRFQWTEVAYYKSVTFIPLAFFGFAGDAIMFHAIFGTVIGHLNHSNLNLSWGPGRYLLNSPRMHIWHHDYRGDAKTTVNFGIIFSCWDWIFGTAKMPAEDAPPKLGFAGVETFPKDFFAHTSWPLAEWIGKLPRMVPSLAGAIMIALALWLSGCKPSEDFVASFGAEARAAGFAHPEHLVSAGELAKAAGDPRVVVIDTRDREKYETAHIARAVSLPVGEISVAEPIAGLTKPAAELEKALRARGVKQGSVVVLYGDGGPDPYRVWWALKAIGGYDARVLDGGLPAWRAAGQRAVTGAQEPVAAEGDVVFANAKEAPLLWRELAVDAATTVLDVRTDDEFTGKNVLRGAKKGGHIPGAKHVHWIDLLESASKPALKSPDALRKLLTGIAPDARVVTMCQSGMRAAVGYFALHQIGHRADRLAVYNGGWSEYSALELPIATVETATTSAR